MQGVVEFRTFEEMASVLATNTPHALILDWWRRLDRAIDEYFSICKVHRKSWMPVLADDPHVGHEAVDQITALSQLRNAIAHRKTKPISPDEAAQYAQKALDLIWLLGEAGDRKRHICL
jgi:hypothetical protein